VRVIGILLALAIGHAAHAACNPALNYTTTSRLSLPRPTINQCNWGDAVQALIDRLDQFACLPGVAGCGLDLSIDTAGRLPLAKFTDDDTNANYCLVSGGAGGEPVYVPCARTGSLALGQIPIVQGDGTLAGDVLTWDATDNILSLEGLRFDVSGTSSYIQPPPGNTGLYIQRQDGATLHRFGTANGQTALELRSTDLIPTAPILSVIASDGTLLSGMDKEGLLFQHNLAVAPGPHPGLRLSYTADGGQLEIGPGGGSPPDMTIYRKSGGFLGVFGGTLDLEQGMKVRASVVSGTGLQHKRQATGSISTGSTGPVTVTWPENFPSTNYTATCTVESATPGISTLQVVHIRTRGVGSMDVDVYNGNAGSQSGTLHCIGMHD
jgi:hypothetical protein